MLEIADLLEDEGPPVHDLERAVFTFKGKSVPGSKLAALLGLTDETGEEASQEKEQPHARP